TSCMYVNDEFIYNDLFFSNIAAASAIYTLSYTTLFRSLKLEPVERKTSRPDLLSPSSYSATRSSRPSDVRSATASLARFSRKVLDRKSTRLNSSHGSISYAVFCLKKKKQSKSVGLNIAL